jgi:hypothetical protein
MSELHPSIISLVSLASGIASNHPAMGQCQLEKLRHLGISEEQLSIVIDIARHIRDEAAQKLDMAFDQIAYTDNPAHNELISESKEDESCCSTTSSGQSCC